MIERHNYTNTTTWIFSLCACLLLAGIASAQFHRAEQDRKITYWLLDPSTHRFLISHDLTIDKVGQKYAHSFVRKGSVVNPDSKMYDVDTGVQLKTYVVSGKDVNAEGYYHEHYDDDTVVVQADLDRTIGEGQSVRVRVVETYTDPVGYTVKDGELIWTRTIGRPLNYITLPEGWMLESLNSPAVITLDEKGRVLMRFTNPSNGDLNVTIKARKREAAAAKPTI
jgi:hypothetical protein